MLARTLRMAFWVSYDHLGKLILANLFWSLCLAAPLTLTYVGLLSGRPAVQILVSLPFAVFTLAVVLPVMTAGLAHLAKELIETRDGSIGTFWKGVALYWKGAAVLGCLLSLACFGLAVNVWFYAVKVAPHLPWIGYLLSALAFWVLAFAGMVANLAIPALVQKRAGVLQALRISALLVIDNPFFCAALAVLTGVMALTVLIPPLFFLVFGAFWMVLATSAYELLARKYARKIDAGEVSNKSLQSNDLRLGQGTAGGPVPEEEDEYLNRGFRDFLFPWKH